MDTQPARYYAYFTDTDAAEGEDDELEVLVEAWDDDGRALILDQEEGCLAVAKDRPGFRRVKRYNEPQVRGVLAKLTLARQYMKAKTSLAMNRWPLAIPR